MTITPGPLNVTPYREGRRVVFGFNQGASELATGTYTQKICDLPAGARVVYAALCIETAAVNGSGTTVAVVQTDEGSPTNILGSTAINLETLAFIDSYTAAGSGGPTSAITCRKKMPAKQAVNLVITIATAAATGGASGFIVLEIADDDLSS